jgi:predicted nuclease of predicted toxin-antitoxin system
VRILLDQMYSPTIAKQLRDRGHDVEAVVERPELVGLADPALFLAAQADSRALVTENVADYMSLHTDFARTGRAHHGLIFTTNAKFPRGGRRVVGALVTALDRMLSDPPALEPVDGWVCWL